jgi:hypothetical protein
MFITSIFKIPYRSVLREIHANGDYTIECLEFAGKHGASNSRKKNTLSIEVATTEQNRSRPGFGQPCLIG